MKNLENNFLQQKNRFFANFSNGERNGVSRNHSTATKVNLTKLENLFSCFFFFSFFVIIRREYCVRITRDTY